jgi:hypothetical protein
MKGVEVVRLSQHQGEVRDMQFTRGKSMRRLVHLCLLATAALLCVGSGKYYRKKALNAAPVMNNPARTGAPSPVASTRYGTTVTMVSYSPDRGSCFHIQTNRSRGTVQAMRFVLRAPVKADTDVPKIPALASSGVMILRATSRLVPYTTTVRDTVRDGSGKVIATRDRNVQRIKTVYSTLARVCFVGKGIPSAKSRFLEVDGSTGRARIWGVWRLR